MYHSVMQTLDLHLEVFYPLPYIAQAIPLALNLRERILVESRKTLIDPDEFFSYVEASLLHNPRNIAFLLLKRVLEKFKEEDIELSSEHQHYISRGILGLNESHIQ